MHTNRRREDSSHVPRQRRRANSSTVAGGRFRAANAGRAPLGASGVRRARSVDSSSDRPEPILPMTSSAPPERRRPSRPRPARSAARTGPAPSVSAEPTGASFGLSAIRSHPRAIGVAILPSSATPNASAPRRSGARRRRSRADEPVHGVRRAAQRGARPAREGRARLVVEAAEPVRSTPDASGSQIGAAGGGERGRASVARRAARGCRRDPARSTKASVCAVGRVTRRAQRGAASASRSTATGRAGADRLGQVDRCGVATADLPLPQPEPGTGLGIGASEGDALAVRRVGRIELEGSSSVRIRAIGAVGALVRRAAGRPRRRASCRRARRRSRATGSSSALTWRWPVPSGSWPTRSRPRPGR